MNSEGRDSLVFMEDASGKVLEFMKESAGDPYFVRYNVMDASLARLKATASATSCWISAAPLLAISSPLSSRT